MIRSRRGRGLVEGRGRDIKGCLTPAFGCEPCVERAIRGNIPNGRIRRGREIQGADIDPVESWALQTTTRAARTRNRTSMGSGLNELTSVSSASIVSTVGTGGVRSTVASVRSAVMMAERSDQDMEELQVAQSVILAVPIDQYPRFAGSSLP